MTDVAVENVVLVPPPGDIGVPDDGAGVQVGCVPGTTVPPKVRPVSAIEPEFVTETTAVPVPDPLATAMEALTWIWLVFWALLAVVVK